jgi:hypothetical protein
MKIGFHVIENHVKILIIVCLKDGEEFNNIIVIFQLLEKNNFSKSSLSIGGIVEGIEHL